jgi:hypothetical protein
VLMRMRLVKLGLAITSPTLAIFLLTAPFWGMNSTELQTAGFFWAVSLVLSMFAGRACRACALFGFLLVVVPVSLAALLGISCEILHSPCP